VTTTTTATATTTVSLGFPVCRCFVGADEAWLCKCHTGRYPVIPARSSPGSGLTRVLVQSAWPHHSAALPSALASCAGVNSIQTCRAGVPVCPWPTWRTLYSLSLDFLVDNACVHRRPRHWLYHWHSFPRSVTNRSPSLWQELGTVCRQKWRLHSVCKHSRLNSRLICFLPLSHSDCRAIGIFHFKLYLLYCN